MVHNYKKKTSQGKWTEEQMQLAMDEARRTSISGASKKYNIPLGTLHRHFKKGSAKKTLGRFRPVFSREMEYEIVNHAKMLDSRFFGLTRDSLKELAFQLAVKNKIPNPFNNNKAGRAWVEGFMKRNPELSFRSPEPTSIARCAAFNRRKVAEFFTNLWDLYEKHHFVERPTDIYNMDETGVKTSTSKPPKLISVKGKRQVGVISSAERGELTTIICCCNVAGNFLPPSFIFGKRKRVAERMLDSAPAGSTAWCTDSGWINTQVFHEWLEFFIKCVRPSTEHPVLLILDNHNSHLNLTSIELAREKGVVMLSVPPHTTHKLQPLDVTVFKSFKGAFETAVDIFQKNHPGRRLNQYDIPSLVKTAFEKSATIQSASSGFRKCGIWPFNKDIFTDLDFAPSEVHFIPEDNPTGPPDNFQHNNGEVSPLSLSPNINSVSSSNTESTNLPSTSSLEQSLPSTSGILFPIVSTSSPIIPGSSSSSRFFGKPSGSSCSNMATNKTPFAVSPRDILPVPEAKRTTEIQRRRRCQKSEVLTSSPFKNELVEKQKLKKVPARKLNDEKDTKPTTKKTKTLIRIPKPPVEQRVPEDNVPCLICDEPYSNSAAKEIWIQCNICLHWAHKLCTDYVDGVFICDFCKENVCANLKKK